MNNKQLSFDISRILSFYLNGQTNEYKQALDNFAKDYYFLAIEEIEHSVDKEGIIYYERIIATYNIFNNLLTSEDDFEDILKVFAIKKDYYPMLEIIYKEKNISHCKLAKKLGKSSRSLTDYIKKLPDFELFTRQGIKRTVYNITNKGKKLVERRKRELDILSQPQICDTQDE